MPKNRIQAKRLTRGLSQRALADAVGTSQQQIQRIEAGVQAARLDLAVKIAAALQSSLSELFPNLPGPPEKKSPGRKTGKSEGTSTDSLDQRFFEAGVDTDPWHWSIKVGFFDGREEIYSVASSEKERISNIIRKGALDFIVFDSGNKRVVVNRTKINYCNFLFDGGLSQGAESSNEYRMTANFIQAKEAVHFDLDPDDCEIDEDDDGGRSQLQAMFFELESYSAGDDEIVGFDDEDGERVYLRVDQILSLEVPLVCCEPRLWRSRLDEADDEDKGPGPISEVDSTGGAT